ncbi:MAG: V-type ATP synthase subunit E [Nitrospirota bacterium]|jgi:vacuolar-type H+-ATPase subunit E/Vma4
MPSRELIERLNKEADERVRAIREKAEGEAEGIREEARRKIEALSRRYRALEVEAVREKTARIRTVAEGEARRVRQGTDEALAARLREIAFSALSGLREKGYEGVFRALAAEVPPALAWMTVRVNPADVGLASEAFPGADVQGDGSITGGLEAASEDGRVRIVNTFEKRLERAWDEILSGLLAEVHEEHASD